MSTYNIVTATELLAPIFENFPEALTSKPQWVLWRLEEVSGRPTKVPYQSNGRKASSTDQQTWATFDHAKAAYENGLFDGLGFVVTDSGLTGIDVDKCVTNGSLNSVGSAVASALPQTYTELSPSGKGLRIITQAIKPTSKCVKTVTDKEGNATKVEIYDEGRFLTITGHPFEGKLLPVSDRQKQLNKLCEALWPAKESMPPAAARPNNIEDSELLERAKAAANGDKFSALWNADSTALGKLYPSDHDDFDRSSADQAICNQLAFWTGNDAERIDALFRQSGLMRDKWERGSYRVPTIDKAIEAVGAETYEADTTITPEQEAIIAASQTDIQKPAVIEWLDITAPDFLDSKQEQWLLEDFIARGDLMTLAAPSKCGKLLFAIWAMQSIIYNEPFLGGCAGPAVPILYLDFENRRNYVHSWYFTFLGERDPQPTAKYLNYKCRGGKDGVNGKCPLFLDAGWIREATKPIEDKYGQPGLVVVDTCRGAFNQTPKIDPNWENGGTVGQILRPVQDWCHDSSWSGIVIHHCNKTGGISGYTDFKAAVDHSCTFSRDMAKKSNVCYVDLEGRYTKAMPIKVATFEGDRFQYRGTADDWERSGKETKPTDLWRCVGEVVRIMSDRQLTSAQIDEIVAGTICKKNERPEVKRLLSSVVNVERAGKSMLWSRMDTTDIQIDQHKVLPA
ncbi:phage NrS-1 polymerase family protein [Anatilimnocola floriformis]|uniref:phage NrS-1 polymerase family protein n=1 Tax=Anatilimnocola floriformis TaxID=2948575 RepID=UPI0020C32725|nr:AAA family ATPase [Anatilimnocola floriformis]